MTLRHYAPAIVLLGVLASVAEGQAPPLTVYDEATLRQASVETDAASLLKLLRQHTCTKGDQQRIKTLIAQLGSPQFEERESAGRELNAIGRPALAALQEAKQKQVDPEVRRRAEALITLLENKLDASVTMSAVRRLIHLRAAGAAERLLDVLPVVDWEVQDEIFHGLPRVALRDGQLDPALLAALEDQSALRRATAALTVALTGNEAARLRVRKLLADQDAEVRLRAAQGLLAVHDAAGLPALIGLLNEPAVEHSWSAEELLRWVAGKSAPTEVVGSASAADRKKAVDAWTVWNKERAARLDWERLDQQPRRPGLYLACDTDSVWLGGCDGKRQTLVKDCSAPPDAMLLPGNELLILSRDHGEAAKLDLAGNQVWKVLLANARAFTMSQRLPSGNILLVNDRFALEINAQGEEVSTVHFERELDSADARKLPSGKLIIRTRNGVAEVDGALGHIVRKTTVSVSCPIGRPCAILPNGRLVFAIYGGNHLLETDMSGKTLRVVALPDAQRVEALRNGHYLVVADFKRLLEVDGAGRTLWETRVAEPIYRVRSILDKLRIGFDKPWPSTCRLWVVGRSHENVSPVAQTITEGRNRHDAPSLSRHDCDAVSCDLARRGPNAGRAAVGRLR